MIPKIFDIWILVQHSHGSIEEPTYGLIAEARRILSQYEVKGRVTAVALGADLESALQSLGRYCVDTVLYSSHEGLDRYQGELFAKVLWGMVKKHRPSLILMAQDAVTSDLSPRLAALMETGLITRAVDFMIEPNGQYMAVRPISNGHLYEKLTIEPHDCPIICFLPSVLSASEPDELREIDIITEAPDIPSFDLEVRTNEMVQVTPERMEIEEADVVVAGGRGVGKGDAFDIIHGLARAIGGTVGGTRPIIDWQILPFERQIGQTGKTVVPRLVFVCGISGANEFTAGMEKSRLVIAINTDPRARIFRFSDLGIIGDVHEVIPLLIDRLKEMVCD